MFEKFYNVEKNPEIPLCGHNYRIDITGKIVNKDGLVVPQSIDLNGNPIVHLNLWDGYREYKVAFIMALCFNRTNVPMYMWRQLDVMFADNNNKNIHPSNLVWKFPVGGLVNLQYPEYAYIPGITRYAVSKTGEVINCYTGKIIKPFNDRGYYKFRLMLDAGFIYAIGRHRLMCLAWLQYSSNVDTLVINHKNGITGQDSINNLEWCTRKENNQHANINGLRTNNEILMKNCETGEIKEFKSVGHCAKYLGLNRHTVTFRVRAKEILLYPGNLQFQYKHLLKPWPEVTELTNQKLHNGEKVKVKSRNIQTGEIQIHDSVVACAKYIKSPIMTIHTHLSDRAYKRPIYGFDIKYIEDDTEWNIYTQEEIQAFMHKLVGRLYPVTLIDTITNKELKFLDIEAASKFLNINPKNIHSAKSRNALINNHYKVKK